MNRKVLLLLLISIFGIEMNLQAQSTGDLTVKKYCVERQQEVKEYQEEMENVLNELVNSEEGVTLQNNEVDISTKVVDFFTDDAIRVNILDNFIISEYDKMSNFSELINEECQWKVPIVNDNGEFGVATYIQNTNGKFEWVGSTFNKNYEELWGELKNTYKMIEQRYEKISSFCFTYSKFYDVVLAYFVVGTEEYLIPYSINAKNFVNGKIYAAKNFFDRMNQTFDEELMINMKNKNGGLPYRRNEMSKHQDTYYVIILLSFISSIIFGVKLLNDKK